MVVKLKTSIEGPHERLLSWKGWQDTKQNMAFAINLLMDVTCTRSFIVVQPLSLHFYNIWKMCGNFPNILHHTLIRDNCDLKMWKGNKFERTYQGQFISNIEISI